MYFSDGADVDVIEADFEEDVFYFLVGDFSVVVGVVVVEELVEEGEVGRRAGVHVGFIKI